MDDEILSAFAGSEISGLSGRTASERSDACFSDGTALARGGSYEEVVSQPAPERSAELAPSDGEDGPQDGPQELKRRRRLDGDGAHGSHVTDPVTAENGARAQLDGGEEQHGVSSPAQEVAQEEAPAADAAVFSTPAGDAAVPAPPAAAEEEEACGDPSTPESPAAPDVSRAAASGASDARDSLAGNALAALAADAETAQSKLTPLLGAAEQSPLQLDSNSPHAPLCSLPESTPAGFGERIIALDQSAEDAKDAQAVIQAAGGPEAGDAAAAVVPDPVADPGDAARLDEVAEDQFVDAQSQPDASPGPAAAVPTEAEQSKQQQQMSAVQPSEKGRRPAGLERQQNGGAAASKKPLLKPWK